MSVILKDWSESRMAATDILASAFFVGRISHSVPSEDAASVLCLSSVSGTIPLRTGSGIHRENIRQ